MADKDMTYEITLEYVRAHIEDLKRLAEKGEDVQADLKEVEAFFGYLQYYQGDGDPDYFDKTRHYHCPFCEYDTHLPEKLIRHLKGDHSDQLKELL